MNKEEGIENMYISVWNCNASLLVKTKGAKLTDDDLKLILTPEEAEKLEELVLEAVDEQGAINWSGIYEPTEKLWDFITKVFREKKEQVNLLIEKKKRETKENRLL